MAKNYVWIARHSSLPPLFFSHSHWENTWDFDEWLTNDWPNTLHVAASNKSIINRMHTCSRPFVPKYSLISWSTLCCHGAAVVGWVRVSCNHSMMRKVFMVTTPYQEHNWYKVLRLCYTTYGKGYFWVKGEIASTYCSWALVRHFDSVWISFRSTLNIMSEVREHFQSLCMRLLLLLFISLERARRQRSVFLRKWLAGQ